jgi:cytidyltransferase-like protein
MTQREAGQASLAPPSAPVRVYVDMVGDLFHAGHVELLRSARAHGDELVVGLLSDETVWAYKRRPIMTLAERVAVVGACRYVDAVLPDAPYAVTTEFLDQHHLDLVVHGDDASPEVVQEVYGSVAAAGRLRLVRHTPGISTTELIDRARRST